MGRKGNAPDPFPKKAKRVVFCFVIFMVLTTTGVITWPPAQKFAQGVTNSFNNVDWNATWEELTGPGDRR